MNDQGIGKDEISITRQLQDFASHRTFWEIQKFESADAVSPFEISKFEGNLLTNAGINNIWSLAAGGAGTAWAHATSAIAVGTNATAATAADTALGTESARVASATSYPTYGTSQQIVFQSSFDGSTANVHWQEFGVFNNVTSGGTMLNHKISDQGTKSSGQVWQISCTIILS